MATLNIQAPDGKTLHIQVPPGTDPSTYPQMVEEVIQHYQAQSAPSIGDKIEPGVYGDTDPAEQKVVENLGNVAAGYGTGELMGSGAKAIAGGLAKVPEAIEGGINAVKGMLPNPSLKAMGYTAGKLATEGGQDLATAARDYATTPQPELGELVAKAGQKAGSTVNPGLQALATPEELAELDAAGVKGPRSELNAPSQTTQFNQPIANGLANSTAQMRDLANEQWKQVGNAISNTLDGLEETNTQFDPAPVLKQIESMYAKDVSGKIMTTGVQGETNQAISDALESLKDYANGEKISWSDANRVKSMLQDSANYAAKRFEESNEAYKQVAAMIKDGIDEQAGKVLAENGGDIQNFQKLRQAYGKLSSLRGALNPAVGKEMLQPSLGEAVVKAGKRMLPYAIGGGLALKAVNSLTGGIH